MQRFLLTVFICSLSHSSWGQSKVDSLRRACSLQNDSLRIDAYLELGKYYFNTFSNADSLIANSEKALTLCTEKNKIQKYKALKLLAVGYVAQLDTVRSIPALSQALQQAHLLQDEAKVADVYHLYAAYFGNLGITDTSLIYLIREAEAAEKAEYYNALAMAYSSIGWIYRGRQQFDLALNYHRKALRIVDRMEQTNLGNIIQVYSTSSQGFLVAWEHARNETKSGKSSGDSLIVKIMMDSVKILADSVLALSRRYERLEPQATAYFIYSQLALVNEEYESALNYIDQALALRSYVDMSTLFLLHTSKAIAYAHLKIPQQALLFLDSAKQSPALNELYHRHRMAEASWEVYKHIADYPAALAAHELLLLIKDSLDNAERTRTLHEIEQRFNKAQNEKEIQRLAAEQEISSLNNKLLTAGIIGAVFLSLIIFLFARQRNLKNEQERLLVEQRLNRARMDPHFLFNTFTALQGMVLKEKDPVKAASYLSDYSVIMRQTLESTFAEMIPIEEEISYLEKYLSLQQMRMGGKFDYTITVDDAIEPAELQIPGMIIQPFIENSIEHGFRSMQEEGMITVSFSKFDADQLLIRIVDNGSGISKNESAKEYPSRATQIIRDQLLLLNKKYKSNAAYFLNPNNGTPGTEVTIFLPQLK